MPRRSTHFHIDFCNVVDPIKYRLSVIHKAQIKRGSLESDYRESSNAGGCG